MLSTCKQCCSPRLVHTKQATFLRHPARAPTDGNRPNQQHWHSRSEKRVRMRCFAFLGRTPNILIRCRSDRLARLIVCEVTLILWHRSQQFAKRTIYIAQEHYTLCTSTCDRWCDPIVKLELFRHLNRLPCRRLAH